MRKFVHAALAVLAPVAARADDGALLKAKMQTLMDAVAPGDRTPWQAILDSRFVATDENGEVFSYDQEIAAIAPLPRGSSGTIKVTDWTARFFGDTAVTTEVDDEHEDFHGQKLHALYRATATWIKEAGDWKLVGLQTMALQQDPPEVALPDHDAAILCRTLSRGPRLHLHDHQERQPPLRRDQRRQAGGDQGRTRRRAFHARPAAHAQDLPARRDRQDHRLRQPPRRTRRDVQAGIEKRPPPLWGVEKTASAAERFFGVGAKPSRTVPPPEKCFASFDLPTRGRLSSNPCTFPHPTYL